MVPDLRNMDNTELLDGEFAEYSGNLAVMRTLNTKTIQSKELEAKSTTLQQQSTQTSVSNSLPNETIGTTLQQQPNQSSVLNSLPKESISSTLQQQTSIVSSSIPSDPKVFLANYGTQHAMVATATISLIGCLSLIIWLKRKRKPINRKNSQQHLELIESLSLDNKHKLSVVRAFGQLCLISQTEQGIQVLMEERPPAPPIPNTTLAPQPKTAQPESVPLLEKKPVETKPESTFPKYLANKFKQPDSQNSENSSETIENVTKLIREKLKKYEGAV